LKTIARLKKNLEASIQAKHHLLTDEVYLGQFSKAVETVVNRYKQGGCIYIAGNGGSAADAQHLAAEFVSKPARDRAPLPAEALTVDSSILTAIGNDYGFDLVFSRQLAGKAMAKDVFLGITTSGQSPNILKALEQCQAMGVPSIVFLWTRWWSGKSASRLLHHRSGNSYKHHPRATHRIGTYTL
jgi:D-sedoheptulose 7-phosphate isomerase